MDDNACRKRRLVLAHGLALGACAMGMTGGIRDAAATKSSKAAFLYQDHPQNGKRCGDCKFFSADGGNSSAGTCDVVEGAVDRSGWCMAFSPKA